MAPSFSDLLRCLCCCQDETDDCYFIVFSNTLRNIRKLVKKDCDDQTCVRIDINTSPSNSEPCDNNFPTSVPPNLEYFQSLYPRKSPSSKPPQFTSILPCTLSSPKTPPPPSSSSSPVYSFAASSSKPPQSSYVSPSSNLSKPPQFTSILPCTSSSPKPPPPPPPPPPSSSSSSPVYSFAASSSKPLQSSYVSPSPNLSKPPQVTSILPCTSSSQKTPPSLSSSSSPVYSFVASSYKPLQSSYVSPSPNLSKPPQVTSILPCTSSSQKTPPPSSSSSSSSPVYSFVASSSKPLQSSYVSPSPSLSNPSPSVYKIPQQRSTKPSLSSTYVAPSSSGPKLSSSLSSSSSPQKIPLLTLKPAPSGDTTTAENRQGIKTNYVSVENDSSLPLYFTPEHIKDLIKRDIVPEVLKRPLSPLSYKEYFSVLLYAEDHYCEKWSDYELLDVTLELHEAAIYKKSHRHKNINWIEEEDDKILVVFKIDAIPEKRPFLLSRDLVYARPSGSKVEPFQGIIYRVVKSNLVLVEFEDDFHSQHYSSRRYDISFSFNRVCLKRAHEALNSISDSLLENFLFPDYVYQNSITTTPSLVANTHKHDAEISLIVRQIVSIRGSPPYLIAGPRCSSEARTAAHSRDLSRIGVIIRDAVIQTYKTSPHCRILICSPSNSTCDILMRGLKKAIPESHMFRANAAFREKEDVPEDILSSSLYKEECFVCPRLQRLREFKVIFSTFMSSFRLHSQGLPVGHFSHIFMVDASSAIEPEAMVPLANFADKNTAVIVTGEAGSSPSWVRSEIGRKNGLKISYFERLCKCRPHHSLGPSF